MADHRYQVDDPVRRKSNGLKMFVVEVGTWRTGDPRITCVWYVAKDEHRGSFSPDAIEPWTIDDVLKQG